MSIPQSVLDRTKSPDFENNIAWMYLDSGGNVTVGAGHMVPSQADAVPLPFINKITGDPASSDAKKLDWNTIHLTESGHAAPYYADFAALRLQQADIDALLLADSSRPSRTCATPFQITTLSPDRPRKRSST